jgi:hypothetical protein
MKNNPKERYDPSPEKSNQIIANVSTNMKYISLFCYLESLHK